MNKQDLALNNQQRFIYHKIQPTNQAYNLTHLFYYSFHFSKQSAKFSSGITTSCIVKFSLIQ